MRGGRGIDPVDVLVPVVSVLAAMIVGGALIALTGANPFTAYSALIRGAVSGPTAIGTTLKNATPLMLTGLSVAIAFRAGLFNIGGTGQFVMGMLAGGFVALKLPQGLPQVVMLPIELAAAVAAGAAWGGLAGWLKAKRGAHEVITTIMFNYIAIRLGEYLLRKGGALQDHSIPDPKSHQYPPGAGLPVLWRPDPFTNVHFALVIALAVAVAVWFMIDRTSLGFRIRSVGFNPDAAEYGGIGVAGITITAMAMAGACAALAGACFVSGDLNGVLSKSDFSAVSAGFTGIAVALLGRNTVPGVILAALLFGGLDAGAQEVQLTGGLDSGVATKLILIIQGLVIFFVGLDMLFRSRVENIYGRLRPRPQSPGGAPL
jgi:simple sugar transport system permease protein